MFQWDLLKCSVCNSVKNYVLYHPAVLPQVTIAQELFATGSGLAFPWLVVGFRPVAESSLTPGLARLYVLR